MADAKNILRLIAAVYEKTPLPYSGIVGLAGDALLGDGGKDDQEAEEKQWARKQVGEWWEMYERLLDAPMSDESKKRTAMGQIYADYVKHFAEEPKERWLEQMHATMLMAVKGDMAYTGDE